MPGPLPTAWSVPGHGGNHTSASRLKATRGLGAQPRMAKREPGSGRPGSAAHCDLEETPPFSRPQFPCLKNGASQYKSEEGEEEAEAQGEEGAPPGTPGTHRGVGPPAHAAAVGLGVLDGVG